MDNPIVVKIKKNHPDAVVPHFSREGDIGLDLYSIEDKIIPAGQKAIVSTGIIMILPQGYAGLIWDRSGMAGNYGIKTMGGVFDPNYQGEWKIILLNTSDQDYEVKKGDRIAQALIQKIAIPTFEEIDELPESNRGDGSFGSSGR